MARLLTCGFETGRLDEFNGAVTPIGATVQTGYKRTGNYALRLEDQSGSAAGGVRHTFGADVAELYFRLALLKDEESIGNGHPLLRFYDSGGTLQLTIYYNGATQMFDLYRGAETSTIAVGTVMVRANVWCMVQGHIVIDNSTGVVSISINNTTALAFSGDTQASSVAGVRSIRFTGRALGDSPFNSYGYTYIDDVAFNDTVGANQATYPGLGGVFLLKPNADGATTTWDTSTGTTHYTLVDDVPANTTDWIQALTTGEIDLFEVEDAPTYVNTINLVEVLYQAAVTESGYNVMTDVLRHGTVNYTDGTATVVGLVPGYVLYKGTPYYKRPDDGTSVWGTADVNALQAGVQIL